MFSGVSTSGVMTAADVERLSLPGKQVELVRGRLVVREPPGTRHGAVAANLTIHLGNFVRQHGLGIVCAQDTGFKIATDPDTVRAPDVAVLSTEQVARVPARGYAEVAPALVIEVVSPDDALAEVLAKVADWLAAGTRLVWLVDPRRRHILVYREDGGISLLRGDTSVDGDDVLPGFTCSLEDVFA
jgi:Uma2 family endonuclease